MILPTAYAQNTVLPEPFDPNALYDIVSATNVYSSIPGTNLSWSGEDLQILTSSGNIIISKQNIEQIRRVGTPPTVEENAPLTKGSKKAKRNTLKGLAIGAGAGAALGIAIGFVVANTGNCGDDSETLECEGLAGGVGIVVGSGIFLVGSVTGLIVGALIKKKEKKK